MSAHRKVCRFQRTRDGHASRIDADAEPQIIVVAIDTQAHELQYHVAGDTFVRAIPLLELTVGDELIAGMAPEDAFLTGAWASEATRQYRALIDDEQGAEA